LLRESHPQIGYLRSGRCSVSISLAAEYGKIVGK
jgi:hypothetical protein